MSRAAPDLVSGTGRADVKVVLINERVVIGHREYIVEHLFAHGLRSADIVFNKSSIEGTFIYSDQPLLNYEDNTLILGLNENKLTYGEASEEILYSGSDEARIYSKPLYVRLVSDGDKVVVSINGKRSYEASKVYLHLESSDQVSVVNILVNPVKILWLSIGEAYVRIVYGRDHVKIHVAKA